MRSVLRSEEPSNSGRLRIPAPASVASCADAWTAQASATRTKLARMSGAVDAPRAGAGGGEIEEHEAVEHRGVAAVQHRPEILRRVAHEIGERHLARQDERHRP